MKYLSSNVVIALIVNAFEDWVFEFPSLPVL